MRWFPKALLVNIVLLGALVGCAGVHKEFLPPPNLESVGSDLDMETILVREPVVIPHVEENVSMSDNSIWNKRNGIFFRDYRAYEVGDILTVSISINDSARIKSGAARDGSFSGGISAGLNIDTPIYALPESTIGGQLESDVSSKQEGTINRSESIQLQIAAAVVEASTNGNLKIIGTQEVRVNSELRILRVEGIVRSTDISPDNSIPYEKIAEARISYGGGNSRRLKRRRLFDFQKTSRSSITRGHS